MEVTITEFWVLTIGAYLIPILSIWIAYKMGKRQGERREKIVTEKWEQGMKEAKLMRKELKKLQKMKLELDLDEEFRKKVTAEMVETMNAQITNFQKRIKKTFREGIKEAKEAADEKKGGVLDQIFS